MIYVNDHIGSFDFEAALPLLSDQRREQALRFRYPLGRQTCAAAYLLLCEGLRKEYGINEKPVFIYGEHGKPFIEGHPEIHFNLSHCREAVVCALSDHQVGIDVEAVRHYKESLARYTMNEEELRQIRIQREEADRQKALLQEKGSQLRKLRNDLSTYMEDKGKYDKCLELEQEVARREAEEQRSRALFPGRIPSETEIQASMDEAVRAKGLKEMLDHVRPMDEEMERLNMLQGAYENPADVERQLKNCFGLCEERSRRKEQVERDQEALNQFMDQNRTGGNSSVGMFILLAIIIMVVGVVCAVLIHMILGILIGLMGVGILGFALGKAKGEKKRQQEILDKQQVLETAVQNSQAQFKKLDDRLAENMAMLGAPDVENPYFVLNRIENELREYKDLAGKQEIYLRKKADVDKLEGKVQAYIRSLGFAPEENLSGQLAQLLLQLKDLEGKSEETELAKQKRDAYIPYREIERLRNLQKPDTDKTMEELAQEEELVDGKLQELLSQVQEYDRIERMLTERYNAWLQNSQEYKQLSAEVGEAKKKYDLIKKTKEFLGQAKNSMTAKYTAPIMDGFVKYYGLLTGEEANDIQMDATTKLSVIEYNLPREISSQSTGIRDLIGVCFRMALIGAMYEKEKPFVVMDDPFVNLDDERRERVTAFMDRMTQEYQVIYFTCHEYEVQRG